jgi:glutamine amidotransferase
MESVALIDYGSGNLRSAEKALRRAASERGSASDIQVTSDPYVVAGADRIVLPGVGAFAACMNALHERDGLVEAMNEAVRSKGAPLLGVCVGMQLLASRGLEFGVTPGLGWIEGDVVRMEPGDPALKVPHMGWNALDVAHPHPLFEGEPESPHMYFTHSFVLRPAEASDVLAAFEHGGRYVAAVARGNVAGVQFHPEKSQSAGLRLLANFLEWRP